MGYMDEYNRLKKKREEEEIKTARENTKPVESSYLSEYRKLRGDSGYSTAPNPNDLILNPSTRWNTGTSKKDEAKEGEKGLDFFQKGAFEDGLDWSDIPATILGTAGDIGLSLVRGASGVIEGGLDLASYGVAGVSRLFGADEFADRLKETAAANMVNEVYDPYSNRLDDYSVLGRTTTSGIEGLGQAAAMYLTGGAAGLGKLGTTALTAGIMGLSGVGSGMSEAYQSDATDLEALKHGLNVGSTDAASELIFGGLGKGLNAVGFSKGLSGADDVLAKAVSSKVKNKIAKNVVEYGIKSGAEGLEEVIAGVAQAYSKSRTYLSDEDFLDILQDENLLEQFVVGSMTSGIAQVPSLHIANKTGTDFVSGLTENEQKVVDKVYEDELAKKGDLTGREKTKLYDDIVKKMERGYIDTDTIESVLGGESYKGYQSMVDEETSLKDELKALKKTPEQQFTIEQRERLNEIEKRLGEIDTKTAKSKLSNEVFKAVKSDRLVESYNEKVRATEDFKADLDKFKGTKHEDAAKKTVENAIKAGASNTNAVHDIVDLAANLSSETGHIFDFKSNEDIKNDFIARQTKEIAKFEALENRTAEQNKHLAELRDQLAKVQSGELIVDGDITGDSIVLNIDSAKPLNRITGHEVTHSLEKAKAYTDLRDTIFTYAKSKGVDVDARIKVLEQKYKGVKDANPEAELVADLVGDYLFTDSDFVNNLSTSNRNLAQRIYDEIKHLYKMATAGGKEARELERVKHAFENAFREAEQNREANEVGDTETHYAIREAEPPKETGVAYKVFFVKDGKLYPPMVANPDGADTPIGVWLDADVGQSAPPSKTGRAQVKAGGKGTQGGSGSLAFRPGWHLGDLPRASQFDRVNPETGKKELFPENFVWAEVEYAKDVDYQEEAMSYGYTENGKFRHAYAGLPRLPENGYYRYRTNPKPDTVPWIITGSMKVNRLLSDAEVNQILEQNGVAPVHRQGGDVGLEKFGFDTTQYSLSNGIDSDQNLAYNGTRGESYARTDEFRQLQAESQRMSAEELQGYHRGDRTLDELVRGRISRVLKRQVESVCGSNRNDSRLLRLGTEGKQYNIYEDVNGELFHDAFEISRQYLPNGELVDLHTVETTEDGIGYNDCYNYLSDDGLSGFSITPDGDLISVFNASGKNGFLRAISDIVKTNAKTLDCYASPKQNLMGMYEKVFGFKTASVMDYNMEYDHDDIAKNHEMPKVAFMVNTENHVELREFAEDQYDEALEYRNSFVNQAATNEAASFMPETDDIAPTKYSFSGVTAKTADNSLLFRAEKMLGDGVDSETIRRETGWHKGYDGQWRFEIDDADFEFAYEGQFTNPDILRANELQKKWRDGAIDQAEWDELLSLTQNLKGVKTHPTTLGDYVKHDKLFEAYPQLKDTKVKFLPLEKNTYGYYSPSDKTIALNNSLAGDNEATKPHLIHEIQHAIQDIEGFATGASIEYWKAKRQDIVNTISGARANLDLWLEDIGYQDFVKSSMQEVVNKEKTLEQHWEDCKEYKANSKYAEQIANCEAKIAEYQQQYDEITGGMTAYEQYLNTAGEIEARDSENRLNYNAEQRRNIRPDIDKNNVVFADARYSLSDSNGNELSPAVQNRFAKSKVVDDDGNLKVVYHGTPNGKFTIFDKSKGSVEGDFGSGFYFTDNADDVERNYEGGGPDFENKVARRAEQIEQEEDITYAEAEARAREELYVGSNKFEVYLNIENPAIVGETTLLDYESFAEEYDRDDYDSEEDYESDVEYLISDKIDEIIWEVEKNVDVYSTDGLAEVLWEAVNEGGIDIAQLKENINNLYLEDSNGNLVGNEVTRQIIESLGYDGIIDPTVSSKFNMGLSEDTTHYIVFKPNQIKSVTNQNPTDNPDINLSLSNKGEDIAPIGNYDFYGKDFRKKPAEDIAPVAKPIAPVVTDTNVGSNYTEEEAPVNETVKRQEVEAVVGDRDGFMSKRATELYEEITSLKKGVRASQRLGYLLDHGHDWRSIKTALLNIRDNPNTVVNPNSAAESVAREMLGIEYDAMVDEFAEGQGVTGKIFSKMKRLSADLESLKEERNETIANWDHKIAKTQTELDNSVPPTQTELENLKASRQKAIDGYNRTIAEKQAKLNGKKNTNTKVAHSLKMQIERLTRLRDSTNAEYANRINQAEQRMKTASLASNKLMARVDKYKRLRDSADARYAESISALEERLEKMSKPEYKTAMQRRAKHNEYTNLMKGLVGDTSTWVDKKLGISYKVNTLRRNLRDIVRNANGDRDIAKADAIYDELQGKYNHNEAELKRESMRIKKVFQDLKLNHAEDTYAHMLGEFRHNPDSKLTEEKVKEFYEKHKGKIDTAKVDKAIEESRKVFDDLIVRVNERLREQGMKEIPYRQGYFPHFTNPKQNWLAKFFNWKPVDNEIPTSIAGLTEDFNPEKSWQSFNKQRKSDTTDYSLEQGLDAYIHGALDWIYHIEDIQKRRALENHIRYIHSEEGVKARIDEINNSEVYDADEAQRQIDAVYAEANNPLNNFVTDFRAGTNTLANKKSSMDRKLEETTNRKIYSVMTNLNNRINANMVVGSFSSALTNLIPITQSWMEVSPVYSLRGMRDTIKSTIRDDGVVNKSDFLTNRLMNEEKLYQTGWDKVSDKAAIMMEAIDSFTSQTVWRSKYLQNISEGMSETEAIKNADQFAENVIAGRSRGNMPTVFDAKNPLTKIFTAFQLEVNNQYGYMFKDAPQDSKNNVRLVKGYATAFLGAYAYNALYSSLVGRDAAFDPISILEDLFGDLFGDDEEEPDEIINNFVGNVLEEVPFVGGLFGGGRVPLSSAIPYEGDYKTFISDISNGELSAKEMLKPLYYLAMPVGGGQIKKTNEGLGMFSDDHPVSGSYTDSGNLRYPVEKTFGNVVQAGLFGQYASKNARDYFDNGRSPLKEKQIQEYIDVDIPISDYWAYRDGLKGKDTLGEKLAYIDTLDLPISKKNILANNQANRDDPIDMAEFGEYGDLEEFDYAVKYPDKYKFLEAQGISVKEYKNFDDDTKDAYSWAYQNPDKYAVSKAVSKDVVEYRTYTKGINKIEADKDAYGKSINGSRKEKVFYYIESLPLDYGQKCILFKSEYKSDDSVNRDILEYLNSREDISYEEMVTVLEELGFTVKGDNVYWD